MAMAASEAGLSLEPARSPNRRRSSRESARVVSLPNSAGEVGYPSPRQNAKSYDWRGLIEHYRLRLRSRHKRWRLGVQFSQPGKAKRKSLWKHLVGK